MTQFHQILPSVSNPKLRLDFVTIPDEQDMGTADALRHIKDKIEVRMIIIILSCFPTSCHLRAKQLMVLLLRPVSPHPPPPSTPALSWMIL